MFPGFLGPHNGGLNVLPIPIWKGLAPIGVYRKAVSFVHTTGKPNLEIDGLEGQVDTVPHVPCTSACIRAFRSDRAASRSGSRWVREMPSVVILSPAWVVTQAGSGFRLPSFVHNLEGSMQPTTNLLLSTPPHLTSLLSLDLCMKSLLATQGAANVTGCVWLQIASLKI